MPKKNIETEIKYKLAPSKIVAIRELILKNGFEFGNQENINDCFLMIDKSPHGGWDFVRLRNIDDKIFFRTEKKWLIYKDGARIRVENEKEITPLVYKKLCRTNLGIKIEKIRTNFFGKIDGRKITISIDELVINSRHYVFIECEAITGMAESQKVREGLKLWLKTKLKLNVSKEAPSMLDFIYSINKNK
jgi:hypothetical protein